jgi:hypothetical protein
MAALAVFTGIRYRDDGTLTSHFRSPRPRATNAAPPGEPEAGGSFVVPGDARQTTPVAGPPVQGQARAVISGTAAGVDSLPRFWARRGMMLDVLPEAAMVYVNDLPIGQVRQFNTMDEVYDFAEPGSYVVRIVAPDGPEKRFVVTATDEAQDNVAKISAKLK